MGLGAMAGGAAVAIPLLLLNRKLLFATDWTAISFSPDA